MRPPTRERRLDGFPTAVSHRPELAALAFSSWNRATSVIKMGPYPPLRCVRSRCFQPPPPPSPPPGGDDDPAVSGEQNSPHFLFSPFFCSLLENRLRHSFALARVTNLPPLFLDYYANGCVACGFCAWENTSHERNVWQLPAQSAQRRASPPPTPLPDHRVTWCHLFLFFLLSKFPAKTTLYLQILLFLSYSCTCESKPVCSPRA